MGPQSRGTVNGGGFGFAPTSPKATAGAGGDPPLRLMYPPAPDTYAATSAVSTARWPAARLSLPIANTICTAIALNACDPPANRRTLPQRCRCRYCRCPRRCLPALTFGGSTAFRSAAAPVAIGGRLFCCPACGELGSAEAPPHRLRMR
jgi:hypothetical protein